MRAHIVIIEWSVVTRALDISLLTLGKEPMNPSKTVILAATLSALLAAPLPAHAQALANDAKLSTRQARKVRALLKEGKSKKAFELLGEGVWCHGLTVGGWSERKNMAFAADLGAYARRAGQLEQAAHCTLSVIPRQGTRHNAAALYELGELAHAMGPDSLLDLLQAQNWAKGVEELLECSESQRLYSTAHEAAYCGLFTATKAPKAERGKIARDVLIKNAAVFAPRKSYLRKLSRKERAGIVRFGMRGHREATATAISANAMWSEIEGAAFGKDRHTPYCAKLSASEREEKEYTPCRVFERGTIRAARRPTDMALLRLDAGTNEVGSGTCEMDAAVHVVPQRATTDGVRYVSPIFLGFDGHCGTGAGSTEVEVRAIRGEANAVLIHAERSTTEGASAYTATTTELLCQQDELGEMSCLSSSWRARGDLEFDTERSERMFPLVTLKGGHIKLVKDTSGDFWFEEYKMLDGLTVSEAIDALPEIEATIRTRYIDLDDELPELEVKIRRRDTKPERE